MIARWPAQRCRGEDPRVGDARARPRARPPARAPGPRRPGGAAGRAPPGAPPAPRAAPRRRGSGRAARRDRGAGHARRARPPSRRDRRRRRRAPAGAPPPETGADGGGQDDQARDPRASGPRGRREPAAEGRSARGSALPSRRRACSRTVAGSARGVRSGPEMAVHGPEHPDRRAAERRMPAGGRAPRGRAGAAPGESAGGHRDRDRVNEVRPPGEPGDSPATSSVRVRSGARGARVHDAEAQEEDEEREDRHEVVVKTRIVRPLQEDRRRGQREEGRPAAGARRCAGPGGRRATREGPTGPAARGGASRSTSRAARTGGRGGSRRPRPCTPARGSTRETRRRGCGGPSARPSPRRTRGRPRRRLPGARGCPRPPR